MYQPDSYQAALFLMLLSMICWGSWANTMKLARNVPFQLFYWDYVIGLILASALFGVTAGSIGQNSDSFLGNLEHANGVHFALALASGAVFNVANILLVASIEIAGMAVAFPVGIGIALVLGTLLNYLLAPAGNPWLIFLGVALVMAAIILDAVAYRRREKVHRKVTARAVQLCIVSGILMGCFYPLMTRATSGEGALTPYSVSFIFSLGVAVCAIPVNYWLMRRPITAEASITLGQYGRLPGWSHFWGVVGGAIWCLGGTSNFVASKAHLVGPAVSYAIGQGATMVSAAWGVMVWKEFAGSPENARRLIPYVFVLFLAGLGLLTLVPILSK